MWFSSNKKFAGLRVQRYSFFTPARENHAHWSPLPPAARGGALGAIKKPPGRAVLFRNLPLYPFYRAGNKSHALRRKNLSLLNEGVTRKMGPKGLTIFGANPWAHLLDKICDGEH
jgi:hypothetical protein